MRCSRAWASCRAMQSAGTPSSPSPPTPHRHRARNATRTQHATRPTSSRSPPSPCRIYAARGLYKSGDYRLCLEAVSHCMRSERTLKEAQHLMAFCLLRLGEVDSAGGVVDATLTAFRKSVALGNDTVRRPHRAAPSLRIAPRFLFPQRDGLLRSTGLAASGGIAHRSSRGT